MMIISAAAFIGRRDDASFSRADLRSDDAAWLPLLSGGFVTPDGRPPRRRMSRRHTPTRRFTGMRRDNTSLYHSFQMTPRLSRSDRKIRRRARTGF